MAVCSIVIPVFNQAALTRSCLEHLLASSEDVETEIIVVDDGSTDRTQELLAGYGNAIQVVTHEANTGFAIACNDGAAAGSGEYVVFLNNDTVPQEGWLRALVSYAEANPRAAVVGSKLLFPDGTIQHAGVVVCQDRYIRHLYPGFPADHPAVNKSRRFQIVTAASALVRREAFERADGFDSTFRNAYEDIDLCLRLGELGYEVHYCHESVVLHLESVSEGRFSHVLENDRVYRERWMDRVRPDDIGYWIEDGLLELEYWESYPVRMSISPLVAAVNRDDPDHRADAILNERARQVFDLLRDNVRLNVLVQEGKLDRAAAANGAESGRQPVARPIAEHRLVCEGEVRWMTSEPSGRIVSVVLPVRNAADRLETLLPRLLEQRTSDQLEVVAFDFASSDGTVELLRRFAATVVEVDSAVPAPGQALSLAPRYARGDVFVFLGQDALPADEGWLEKLVSAAAEGAADCASSRLATDRSGPKAGLQVTSIAVRRGVLLGLTPPSAGGSLEELLRGAGLEIREEPSSVTVVSGESPAATKKG